MLQTGEGEELVFTDLDSTEPRFGVDFSHSSLRRRSEKRSVIFRFCGCIDQRWPINWIRKEERHQRELSLSLSFGFDFAEVSLCLGLQTQRVSRLQSAAKQRAGTLRSD